MDTGPDESDTSNTPNTSDTPAQRLDQLNQQTFVGVPQCRLEVSKQKDTLIKFVWQNEQEIKRTYRPPYVTLNAFSSDKEFKERLGHDVVPSYPFLPMAMHCSPIIAMIEYDTKRPWIHRWCTSQTTLWTLIVARLYIRLEYGETQIKKNDRQKAQAFDRVTQRYDQGVADLKEWIRLLVDKRVYEPMKQAGIRDMNHPECKAMLDTFAACLCEYTYRLVHLNEKIIYQYMRVASPPDSPFHKRPLVTLLTPRNPNGDVISIDARRVRTGDEIMGDLMRMEQWFKDKQSWALVKGMSNAVDYEPVTHMQPDEIRQRWHQGPNYANLVPYQTLWEYCMLLDGDGKLGDASKGTPYPPQDIKTLRSILKHRDDRRKARERAGVGPGRFEFVQ